MTGTWRRDGGDVFVAPVGEIAVFDDHRQWAAGRLAVAEAGRDANTVLFYFHAPASTITLLSARKFTVDILCGKHQPGR